MIAIAHSTFAATDYAYKNKNIFNRVKLSELAQRKAPPSGHTNTQNIWASGGENSQSPNGYTTKRLYSRRVSSRIGIQTEPYSYRLPATQPNNGRCRLSALKLEPICMRLRRIWTWCARRSGQLRSPCIAVCVAYGKSQYRDAGLWNCRWALVLESSWS